MEKAQIANVAVQSLINIFTANSVEDCFKKTTPFLDFKNVICIGSLKNQKIAF